MEGTPPFSLIIPARSKRQAMEWALVLASQGINATVDRTEDGWGLWVEPAELDHARSEIALYQAENRAWGWRRQVPGTGLVFHWGAAIWAGAMAVFYYLSMVRFPGLKNAGMVDSAGVRHGQWWRLFTAVTLHENLPHLLGNLATGFFLMGLAMARFGPGVAMLAAFLAGAAGNYASAMLDPREHYSLGASGMVTAALGLVTVQTFAPPEKYRPILPLFPRALAAGILILVLIGFSPETDVVAHVAGFVAGAVLGVGLALARPATLHRTLLNLFCAALLAGLVFLTWRLATQP